jgi:hypothetical protein
MLSDLPMVDSNESLCHETLDLAKSYFSLNVTAEPQ